MQAEIITIGDEILIGQIVDTNSAWMGAELSKVGIGIIQITSVHDDEEQITEAITNAFNRADVVLLTGGIGPTKDDITKHTLCRYFNSKLVFNELVYADIEALLTKMSRAINELTASQAMVPDNATVIRNPRGTAPITWFDHGRKVLVSMPGVPYEMKHAMTEHVIPMLRSRYDLTPITHIHFMVSGYPESALALKIADWENSLPLDVKLAYLPNFRIVKLRLTTTLVDAEKQLAPKITELREILGDAIVAEEDIPLEMIIGRELRRRNKTLSVAESCTGGHLAHKITLAPGSSEYFRGGVVAYGNDVKTSFLGVEESVLRQFGAVSREVAEQMAAGVRTKMQSDYAVAVTGIAGPGGGTPEKPVGTVWIAIAGEDSVYSSVFQFNLDRALNIERSSQIALLQLLRFLQNGAMLPMN